MDHSTKKLGMMFTLGGWILGFLLLALIFFKILDHQTNPNQTIATSRTNSSLEIVLKRNRQGHYVFNGEINQKQVTFLVDTGATMTSIPTSLARPLRLEPGAAISVSTANGLATAYATKIDELKLGDITLFDTRASLVPGLQGNSILLGMNILKHMDLVQRNDELVISYTP